MTTNYTSCLGAVWCPKCGRRGQLKRRRQVAMSQGFAFYVDHYRRGNNHASGFDHACYIGIAKVDLAKRLFRLNHNEKILVEVQQ